MPSVHASPALAQAKTRLCSCKAVQIQILPNGWRQPMVTSFGCLWGSLVSVGHCLGQRQEQGQAHGKENWTRLPPKHPKRAKLWTAQHQRGAVLHTHYQFWDIPLWASQSHPRLLGHVFRGGLPFQFNGLGIPSHLPLADQNTRACLRGAACDFPRRSALSIGCAGDIGPSHGTDAGFSQFPRFSDPVRQWSAGLVAAIPCLGRTWQRCRPFVCKRRNRQALLYDHIARHSVPFVSTNFWVHSTKPRQPLCDEDGPCRKSWKLASQLQSCLCRQHFCS